MKNTTVDDGPVCLWWLLTSQVHLFNYCSERRLFLFPPRAAVRASLSDTNRPSRGLSAAPHPPWRMQPLSGCGSLWSCRALHVSYGHYAFFINSRYAAPLPNPPDPPRPDHPFSVCRRWPELHRFLSRFPLCLNQVQIGGSAWQTMSALLAAATSYTERRGGGT